MAYSDLVTANIKTFLRPAKFKATLDYVIKAGVQKVVVGYDGPKELLEEHKAICDEYKDKIESLAFRAYPFNLGISAVRNRMLSLSKTKYILLLDDDQYVPAHTLGAIELMEKYDDIGAVGFGWILPNKFEIDAHDIKLVNGYYVRVLAGEKEGEFINGHPFLYAFDFIPNSAIFRKAIFRDVAWDEAYKINREHEDYFLAHKQLGKWRFAIDLGVWVYHDIGGEEEYAGYRKGIEAKRSVRYFRKKWQLKGIVGNPRHHTKLLDSYGYLMHATDYMKQLLEKAILDKVSEDELFLY